MALPQTMKAFKCKGEKLAGVVETKLPDLRPDYVLVKVSCVALNPTDWKHIDSIPTDGATMGCDYSGTIVSVGSAVKKPWKPGDRVAGFTHGCNAVQPEDGCFSTYCVAKGDLQLSLPPSLSDAEASTLGVAIVTISESLYHKMRLPLPLPPPAPDAPKPHILIYGASTASGLAALQFARLSGFTPVATCSARNAELVKRYGAEATFEYGDADACARAVREHTRDRLLLALDCISEGESARICAGALASDPASADAGGGAVGADGVARYCALLPCKIPRDDVDSSYVLAYTVINERFVFRGGKEFAAQPDDFAVAAQVTRVVDELLRLGKVMAPPMDERSGGLDAIHEGVDDLRQGKVSGRKIVYPL